MLLNPGTIIDNNQLIKLFQCSTQGGMRRSHKTNTLVLVSNHLKSLYDDRWIDDVFHYTGMGTEGDQSLDYMQNKTLTTSNATDITIHLFEVFEDKKYTYMGEVYLASEPYSEIQLDNNNMNRLAWVFPIQQMDGKTIPIKSTIINHSKDKKEKRIRRMSDEEVKKRAQRRVSKTGTRQVTSIQRDRDPFISEHTKRKAAGICQLCNEAAPFKNKKSEPYLETHHIIWLAKGGEDSIGNTVALCPNCHRKMHILNLKEDVDYLIKINELN